MGGTSFSPHWFGFYYFVMYVEAYMDSLIEIFYALFVFNASKFFKSKVLAKW